MSNLSSNEIRKRFIDFFRDKDHEILPSASVIPENDPTLLFVNSGMYPLVPYLMGESHPQGKRLANIQKCIRTIDIDEVGDNRHNTFFEMLGCWSLGDYFREEIILWTYKFLTDEKIGIGLDVSRLYVTCFEGDDRSPKDTESAELWMAAGIPQDRIHFLPAEENWWQLPGKTGPCGPDSEIYYDLSGTLGKVTAEEFVKAGDDGVVVEIGNDVFMEFAKDGKGGVEPLPRKNIDVGWGLERLAIASQGVQTIYEIDTFKPLIDKVGDISKKQFDGEFTRPMRIIADHIKAATMLIGDQVGATPSNVEQGYIVRRLIRRAIREGNTLGIKREFTVSIAELVIQLYGKYYPELETNKEKIRAELQNEEAKFLKTLEKGLREFEKLIEKDLKQISGHDAFILFSTYGFPLEITMDLAAERGALVDKEEYQREFEQHQELSRSGAKAKFKGGLAEDSDNTRKLHTATHLLHKVLKMVLGDEVEQKGSNITPERLRFDFNYAEKLTDEQKAEVEKIVNDQIQADLPVVCTEMTVDEAKKDGAIGLFEEEYEKSGGKVKVYTIGETGHIFSKEICGGPHVETTGELKSFKITSEKSSSAGIRRIKAVIGFQAKG
ncbi:MAG: alanine--tRNA ligase [Candidatus Kerfeldbacteria bacterium]